MNLENNIVGVVRKKIIYNQQEGYQQENNQQGGNQQGGNQQGGLFQQANQQSGSSGGSNIYLFILSLVDTKQSGGE